MAVCSPQSLMSNASCFDCLSDGWQRQLVRLALLVQILNKKNPAIPTDPNSLLANASCFSCLTAGEKKLIKLQLLCQIAGGIP